jgi:hypothetical protein
LEDSDSWYLHVRTQDNAGNWASDAAHYGPFYIDDTDPVAWINMSSHIARTNPFSVWWNGSDAGSGISAYDAMTSTNGVDWYPWIWDSHNLSESFLGERGELYYFRVRALDEAGNLGDWSDPWPIRIGVDVTVRAENEWGATISGVEVYLSGERVGATAPDGTLAVADAVLGDELAAKHLVAERAGTKGEHEWPYGSDWSYRTYITNVDFDADGNAQPHIITDTYSTQVLVLRKDNTLVGFHPLVSVEWDADSTYLDEVVSGFRSASDYLFDLTDGQMIFEAIEVVDDRVHWNDADFRIYASNIEWPHARIGGIRQAAGAHAHLGRYFDGTTAETGPWDQQKAFRTIIHEFGHYGFTLDDEYVDASGIEDGGCTTDRDTTPPDEQACFMDNHYHATEICSILPDHPHNEDTAQHDRHSEPCWNTIHDWYRSPTDQWTLEAPQHRGSIMAGPGDVPVEEWTYFSLTDADTGVCAPHRVSWRFPTGGPVIGAWVWIDRGWAMQQGRTHEDGSIILMGAHDGDTLRLSSFCGPFCTYFDVRTITCPGGTVQADLQFVVQRDPFGLHVGAVPLGAGEELEISVKASTELSGPPDVELWQDGAGVPLAVVLTYDGDADIYTGTVTMDDSLGLNGQFWVEADDLLGQPVASLVPFQVEKVAYKEPARLTSLGGNMVLRLQPNTFLTDTAVTILPSLAVSTSQENLMMVGDAYKVSVSTGGASLATGEASLAEPVAVNMRYHAEMVAEVAHGSLQIHRWDDTGEQWVPLASSVAPEHNLVSALSDHLSTFAVLGRRKGENDVYLPVVLKE